MGKVLLSLAILLVPAAAWPAWWAENDYSFGTGRTQREALAVYTRFSRSFMGGAGASFYKNDGHDLRRVYAFRSPVTYYGRGFMLTMKPFIYPASSGTGSSAGGARLHAMLPLRDPSDDNYFNLTIGGAAARQKTPVLSPTSASGPETFSETAFEAQIEKSYFKQFFFQLSAAGFSKSGISRNSDPERKPGADAVNPVMDHGELAYTGAFRPVTSLPKWTTGIQFARNMAPAYDSYIYAGYSRISFRSTSDANSFLGGIKLKLHGSSSLDLAYNRYRINGESGENYYKLVVQVLFK
ncbi:MAG TPA: hypothetical protein PL037_04725 [Elusimicrobiales bacterium]|nr:hypothetical protein [Elusimicrobiales bacterium]